MTFDKMYSEAHYIQEKHFTNLKCLEIKDMASITLKVIFTEKVLISMKFNLKLKPKYFHAKDYVYQLPEPIKCMTSENFPKLVLFYNKM